MTNLSKEDTNESKDWLDKLRLYPEQTIKEIYDTYRTDCIQFLKWKLNMRTDEAEDVFQDTIIIFFQNVKSGRLTELFGSLKNYLYTISWRIGLKYISINKNKIDSFEEHNFLEIINVEMEIDNYEEDLNERAKYIKDILLKMQDPCAKLLFAYYYEGLTHKEIAVKLNYKNENVAKAQKYRCMKKLMKVLKKEYKN